MAMAMAMEGVLMTILELCELMRRDNYNKDKSLASHSLDADTVRYLLCKKVVKKRWCSNKMLVHRLAHLFRVP